MTASFLKIVPFAALLLASAVQAQPVDALTEEAAPQAEISEPVMPPDTGMIAVSDNAPILLDLAGTLDAASSGYPRDVWQGSNAATLIERMNALNSGLPADGIRDAAIRLLSARAAAPSGADASDVAALTEARARALFALGKDAEAKALAESLPADQRPASLTRFLAELAIVRQEATVCEDIPGIAQDADSFRFRMLCQLAQGKPDEAQLTVDLAAEQAEADPFLNELIAASRTPDVAIAHYPAKPDLATLATIIHLGRGDAPPAYFDLAPVPLLVRIAENDRFSKEIRAVAAERAVSFGALPAEALATTYKVVDAKSENTKGVKASARFYQLQAKEKDIASRAKIIADATLALSRAGLRETAYKLYFPPARELISRGGNADLSPLARDGFAMLLLQGDATGALSYLDRAAEADRPFLKALGAALIAAKTGAAFTAAGSIPAPTDARDIRMLFRLNTVLGPLGYGLNVTGQESLAAAPATGNTPNPALLSAFDAAQDRQGEQMLLAALLIGKPGFEQANDQVLKQLVTGLQARYPDLARMMAVRSVLLVP